MIAPKRQCAQCGGGLRPQTITHTQQWGEAICRLEKVPAWVCAQCGEVWLSAAVSQAIERLVEKPPRAKRWEKVPVYCYPELAPSRPPS